MPHHSFILWNLSIILESLPISSSGHLRLICMYLFPHEYPISDDVDHLQHIPNAVIIAGVLLLHYSELSFTFIPLMLIANLITGVSYLLIKKYLHQRVTPLKIFYGFVVSGCLIIASSFVTSEVFSVLTWQTAILIGLAQTSALLPGISRLAATCCTGIVLGISPLHSFLFSLVCQICLIGVAACTTLIKKNNQPFLSLSRREYLLLFVSCGLSFGALSYSLYAFTHGIAHSFGWYLIISGLAGCMLIFSTRRPYGK